MSENDDISKGSPGEMSSDDLASMTNGSTDTKPVVGDRAGELSSDEGYATLQKPVANGKTAADQEEEEVGETEPTEPTEKSNPGTRKLSLTSSTMDTDDRRSDEPTKLSFEKVPENKEETAKRKRIEAALANKSTATYDVWKAFALSDYGLVNDDLRRQIWPLLVNVSPDDVEPVPSIDELKSHVEYNQVILDVNRSLKRFPPGIPYEQRIALQDQLTVLIMRVITKYPHLRYYQGYHDVAITFLLVVGEDVAFHVMEVLSTQHLVECMQETMEPTNRRLKYLYPLLQFEAAPLCAYLEKSYVGTLFALPWFLTWFGHSLNQYRDVVRLYDYFLASPHLMPIYVTAAIVLYREADIFQVECDMGALHCLLSQLPDDLPFEYLLVKANELYARYPPESLEVAVDVMLAKEQEQRKVDEEVRKRRQAEIQRRRQMAAAAKNANFIQKMFPHALLYRRSIFVSTALSIVVGLCAYYYRHHLPAIR